MNKKERQNLKETKYKKRLRQLGLENQKGNFFAYKSHGKPCSCKWCRDSKYRETRRTEKINVLNGEIRESCEKSFCQFTIETSVFCSMHPDCKYCNLQPQK